MIEMDYQSFIHIYIYQIWIGSALLGAIGIAGLVYEYLKEETYHDKKR